MSDDKKLMETVRLLLARAEHPNTPPEEADTALRRANALMARHAIDEALVRATQTARERRAPVVEKWNWASAHEDYDRRNRADSSGLRAGRAAAADVALSRGTAVRADSGRKAVGR